MAKISMKSRREVIEKQSAKYKKSSKKGKGIILDSLCLSSGLSRDRIKKLLGATPQTIGMALARKPRKRGRETKYNDSVRIALEKVWACMDLACGRRLAAGMNQMLDALLRFGEIDFDKETLASLRSISPATIDRLLKRAKEGMNLKGISTTKPGTEWDDAVPGYVEIDL